MSFVINWKNHKESQSDQFFEQLRNDQFTDCVLSAGGQIVKAHKMVLAAASPYFLKLFTQTTHSHDVNTIILHEMCYGDVCNIIEFIYTGSVKIDFDQLVHFLKVAKSLDLRGVKDYGIDTARKMMDEHPDNAKRGVKMEPPSPAQGNASQLSRKRKATSDSADLSENQSECHFCHRAYTSNNTLRNHERFCKSNPNHSISRCSICQEEVPVGSMTFHKRKVHGHVAAIKPQVSQGLRSRQNSPPSSEGSEAPVQE